MSCGSQQGSDHASTRKQAADWPTSPVAAEIHVSKIEGLSADFIRGADISSYISQIDSGVIYYDWDGDALDEQGFFDLLADAGLNYVRLRIWNDPYDENGNGYGGGNNDVEKAIRMGKWATNAGMKVLVNFHYSDFWADPGKQVTPKAWENLNIDDKVTALAEFTEDTLRQLLDAGIDVGMVQVGNETNSGFSGERKWGDMAKLYQSGCETTRKIAEEYKQDILIAVHFTDPHNTDSFFEYAKAMDRYKMDYDVFAASYYPFWHGSLENLKTVLSDIAKTFDKKVLVTETSYTYTFEEGDGHSNSLNVDTVGVKYPYPVNVQGQATAIRDIINTIAEIGDAGLGVIYWEPAWIPVGIYNGNTSVWEANQKKWEEFGSGWASSYAGSYDPADAGLWYGGSSWDNQAMFDFSGHPLPSLNIWKYVYYGATAPRKVENVLIEGVKANPGEAVTDLPTATVIYNDATQEVVDVRWQATQIEQAIAAGNGSYEIHGTAVIEDADYPLIFMLDISPINYFPDPSFEEGITVGGWMISNPDVAGIRHEPNNAKTGEYCLHFWSEDPIEFTAEIKVTDLEAGTYNFVANLQGGDVGSNAEFIIYAQSDLWYETATGVTKWQEWHSPEINGIYVHEGSRSITFGISVKCAARGWGSFDDFYLYKAEE